VYFYYLRRGGCVLALVCLFVCLLVFVIRVTFTRQFWENIRDAFGMGRLWDNEQYFGDDLNPGFEKCCLTWETGNQ